MAALFTEEWAEDVRQAINAFPDDDYRATKLDLFWNWIDVARKGFTGTWSLGTRTLDGSGPAYLNLDIKDGVVTKAAVEDSAPGDAVFVLIGDYEVWKDIVEGYDAGKAVMYRRLRLEKGDAFRFFNRIYFFTESLVALSKVPATLPG